MNPYILMTVLYLTLAILAALDSTFASLNLLSWFNGLRWLRVHFITLGTFVEIVFGVLPILVAARAGTARPATRWDIWLALNAGIITLLIGIPLVNAALIVAGGTFIFAAAVLLLKQLAAFSPDRATPTAGRPFYLAGLSFLLLGIAFGAGLWLGWGEFLRAAAPKEIHLHANLWGFASLTFAGLLIDLYPGFAGRPLAWQSSLKVILGLFIIGDLNLIAGPWLGNNAIMVFGLLLHHAATALLFFNVFKPLFGDWKAWNAGTVHLFAAYAWIIAGLVLVPVTMFGSFQIPLTRVEAEAPLILVFGWVLQFVYALAPCLFARMLLPDRPAKLGGNGLSVIALNLGTLFVIAAILSESLQATFDALAFAFWAISLLPIATSLWRIIRARVAQMDATSVSI